MLGYLFIFIKTKNKERLISNCLLFSSSVMLTVSLFDLIPSSYASLTKTYLFIPSMLIIAVSGLFGALLIRTINTSLNSFNSLYKIGIISMLALVIHNIPEGIITFISTTNNTRLGILLSFSIALHNIPEGITIAVPIFYSTKSKKKAFVYTFISSISEPLGALIAYFLINIINNSYFFSLILSFTAGIMIYLSIFELFIEGVKSSKIKDILIFISLGFLIIIFSIFMI